MTTKPEAVMGETIVVAGRECEFIPVMDSWMITGGIGYHLTADGEWSMDIPDIEDFHPTGAVAHEFARQHADQPEPAAAGGVELPTGPGVWFRNGDRFTLREMLDDPGTWRLRAFRDNGVEVEWSSLRGHWHPAPATELAELRQYKTLFNNALDCVDQIFQKCAEVPEPILPDFCNLGEDKFAACVRMAEDFAALRAEVERLRQNGCELNTRIVALEGELEVATTRAETAERERDALREACSELVNDRDDRVSPGVKESLAKLLTPTGDAADGK